MSISSISFILIYLSGIVGSVFSDPLYGVLAYMFVYFVNPNRRWWFNEIPHLRFSFIAFIFIAAGYAVRAKKFQFNRIFHPPQTKWLLCQTLLVIALSLVAVDPRTHNDLLIKHIKYILFALIFMIVIDNKDKFEKVKLMVIFGCTYIGYYGWQVGRYGGVRLENIGPGDSREVNATAQVVLCSIPLIIYYLLQGKKWQKAISLISLAFCLNVLILFNSRGAFLALIVSMFYMFYHLLIQKKQYLGKDLRIKVIALILVGIAGFLYLTDEAFWDRMSTLQKVQTGEETGGGRVELWMTGIRIANDYPLGVGGGGFMFLSPRYIPHRVVGMKGGAKAVHSLYFEVLSENGYLGLILLLGYIISTFRSMRKVKKDLLAQGDLNFVVQAVALESAFIGYLVAAIFGQVFYREFIYWLPAFCGSFYLIHANKTSY